MTDRENIDAISKSTTITLGLAVTILMSILGAIGAGAWWAASMSGKMDYVTMTATENRQRIVTIESSALRLEHVKPLVREIVTELLLQQRLHPSELKEGR